MNRSNSDLWFRRGLMVIWVVLLLLLMVTIVAAIRDSGRAGVPVQTSQESVGK